VGKLPANAPVFWEGQEDIRFLRWKENIVTLSDHLTVLSETLTSKVVDLLREKIDPSIAVLESRPLLHDTVKHLTLKYLNRNYEETVEHIKYLATLEKNVSYNTKTMEEKFNQVQAGKGLPTKDDGKKGGILSYFGGSGGVRRNQCTTYFIESL
jgi:hypothetical protein